MSQKPFDAEVSVGTRDGDVDGARAGDANDELAAMATSGRDCLSRTDDIISASISELMSTTLR